MADWDTDSDEDASTSAPAKAEVTKAQGSNWDDSDSDDNDQTHPTSQAKSTSNNTQSKTQGADDWESSDEPDENAAGPTQSVDSPNGTAKSEEADLLKDKERMAKLAKKMKNAKKRQRQKQNKQRRKNQKSNQKSKKSQDIRKAQSKAEDSDSSDSSDSSDGQAANGSKKKMMSYSERMATDNDILFKGHEAAKAAMNANGQDAASKSPEKKEDDRVMLSGEVTLKNFPMGSAKDCENFAQQITNALDQKLFEEAIDASDVYVFFNKILSAEILDKLDMVDTKALCTKTNALLNNKQKAWHKKKNPTGKKKKKPQWIVSDKFKGGAGKSMHHKDGQYDAGEFDFL